MWEILKSLKNGNLDKQAKNLLSSNEEDYAKKKKKERAKHYKLSLCVADKSV